MPTVLPMASIVSEKRFANKIMKYNQEIAYTEGTNIFTITTDARTSVVNHKSNSVSMNTKKMIIGTAKIAIKIMRRLSIIPLNSFGMVPIHSLLFHNFFIEIKKK